MFCCGVGNHLSHAVHDVSFDLGVFSSDRMLKEQLQYSLGLSILEFQDGTWLLI